MPEALETATNPRKPNSNPYSKNPHQPCGTPSSDTKPASAWPAAASLAADPPLQEPYRLGYAAFKLHRGLGYAGCFLSAVLGSCRFGNLKAEKPQPAAVGHDAG